MTPPVPAGRKAVQRRTRYLLAAAVAPGYWFGLVLRDRMFSDHQGSFEQRSKDAATSSAGLPGQEWIGRAEPEPAASRRVPPAED